MSEKALLSFFWNLASTNEKIRIDAAVGLIDHLTSKESQQKDAVDLMKQSDDLSYTLKRLVKGLGSSRKAARQGFAMALTEIILQFDHISVDDILQDIKDLLVVTKSCSSQEERDAYFGQIFGLAALGRVICLAKQYGNANISKSSIRLVVERLKELSSKKSYLQEICYKAIVDIMSMLPFNEFHEYVFHILENDIKCSWEKCPPHSLILVLATWRLFKDEFGHKMFKKSWKNSHIDSVENYPVFAKILQNSHSSHPRVHYIWQEVLHLALNSSKSDFEKFWTIVIDENLFQSSHERKFLGFKLLEKVLPMLSSEQVRIVFSPQLMHCLFNSLAQNTNYLYAATKQTIEGIGKTLIQNRERTLIVEIIKQLLGRNGNICFDATTKTKAVENLLPKLPVENLPNLVSWMKGVFTVGTTNPEDGDDPKNVEKTREGILGLFLSLMRCKQLPHTASWVLDAVYFIFENAYFIQKDVKSATNAVCPPVSRRTRILCQQRFNRILGELATLSAKVNPSSGLKSKDMSTDIQQKTFGLADDGCLWISHIMHHAKMLLKKSNFQMAEESWTEEINDVFGKTMKIVRKLEQKSAGHTLDNHAFVMMFLYVGVQLFSETQQAQEILEELFQCYDKVKSQSSQQTQGNEPPWMDVVTEILLSFLTESSNLRRQVVDQVFNIIVPHLTPSALNIILEAIDPRNGLSEDSSLQVETVSENEAEEMESDGDHKSEQDASTSDDDDTSDDNENESDDNENESDENEVQDSVDPLFKVDLQAALGNALAEEESDDDDEVNNSEGDLDDEAMMKLDDALSEVFKQHLKAKDEKKKTKDAKKSVLHFKLRVLDLVEILIKKQPCNVLILELIQPLLNVIRVSLNSKDYQTLGERAQGIFKNKLCAIRERAQLSASYVESAHRNIELLLKQAMKAPSVTMVTLMSSGCLFLIRQLHGSVTKETSKNERKRRGSGSGTGTPEQFGHLDVSRLKTAYGEALKDFMLHRNTHLHSLLFQELINRHPVIGWCLAEDLVAYITQGINNFRKIQACAMLSQLLNRKVHGYMDHIKSLVAPLQEAFRTTFNKLSSSDVEMKAKHFREILKLATRFVKILRTESDLWSLLDVKSLEKSLVAASESKTVDRAHDLKNLINRLSSEIAGESTNGDMVSTRRRKRKRSKRENSGLDSHNKTQNGEKAGRMKNETNKELKTDKKKNNKKKTRKDEE